jgi:hypothetical protein
MKLLHLLSLLLLCCHQLAWGISCPVPDPDSTAGKVIVNEINFHAGSAQGDWLELYVNEGSWDLTGWQLVLLINGKT